MTVARRSGNQAARHWASHGVVVQGLDELVAEQDMYDLYTFQLVADPFRQLLQSFNTISSLHGAGLYQAVKTPLGRAAGIASASQPVGLPGMTATFVGITAESNNVDGCGASNHDIHSVPA